MKSNRSRRAVLIDGKNMMFYVQNHRSDVDVVYSFLKRLSSLLEFCDGVPVVVWEQVVPGRGRAGANWRASLATSYDYKGNRTANHHVRFVQRSMPFVAAFFDFVGMLQAACESLEADDLIGLLAGEMERRDWKVFIASNDRDYYQLASPSVIVVRPSRSGWQAYDAKRITEETGIPPEYAAKVKAVCGDAGDNFQPVRGLGPKTARQYVMAYGLDPSLPSFHSLPRDVQATFRAYRKLWSRFHDAYRLGYLPKDVRNGFYPREVKVRIRRQLRSIVESIIGWDEARLKFARERIVQYCRYDESRLRDLMGLLRK